MGTEKRPFVSTSDRVVKIVNCEDCKLFNISRAVALAVYWACNLVRAGRTDDVMMEEFAQAAYLLY